jgi:hypothetical protein
MFLRQSGNREGQSCHRLKLSSVDRLQLRALLALRAAHPGAPTGGTTITTTVTNTEPYSMHRKPKTQFNKHR